MKRFLSDLMRGPGQQSEPAVHSDMQSFVVQGVSLEVPQEYADLTRVMNALRKGHYERQEASALQHNLEQDDRLLDLGSGLGFVACKAGQTLAAENITCVEANPNLIPVIKRNLDTNGLSAARVLHGAVCATDGSGETDFHVGANFTASSRSAEGRRRYDTIQVPALSFSELLSDIRPTVITCDVEGEELELFRTPLPPQVRLVVMEVHLVWLGDVGIQKLFDAMHRQGFVYRPKGSSDAIVCFKRIEA